MAIILAVLILLNTYPVWLLQRSLFSGKHSALAAQANLISSELSSDDIGVEQVGFIMDILYDKTSGADRVVVCDASGLIVYDSSAIDQRRGRYFVNADMVATLAGEDIFRCVYQDNVFSSQMSVPIIAREQVAGALYISQDDPEEGQMLLDMRHDLFTLSLLIFIISVVLGLFFSVILTHRFTEILKTIGVYYEGNYDYAMPVRGKDELAEVASNLNRLAEILKKTESLRQQFVSDASHELKTPLASVRLLTDSILQTPDMPMALVREFVTDIGDETDRLSRMTEKLMQLSRLEASQAESEVIDPVFVIRRAVRMLRPLALEAGIELRSELEKNCLIKGSEDDLYHIVFNLLDNAVKYNQPEGQVKIDCRTHDGRVYITVCDTGLGIPAEGLPHIFDRFYRVDKARNREAGGAGLGLSIVAHTTKRMGGALSVDSEPGKGTQFDLIFPLADAGALPEPEESGNS
jgi:signal transduction histidine kinase